MKVQRYCALTRSLNEMDLPLTMDQLDQGEEAHRNGALIQHCFPQLSADQREFLITGLTPQQWDMVFGESEQEHNEDIVDVDGVEPHKASDADSQYVEDVVDQLDAIVFSGDTFLDPVKRKWFAGYLGRWSRRLEIANHS